MKRFCIILLTVILHTSAGAFDPSIASGKNSIPSERKFSIRFSENLQKALEDAKHSKKPIFLFFGEAQCEDCRIMKDSMIKSFELGALTDRFHWIYTDTDKSPSLSRAYKVHFVPQFFILDHKGKIRRHSIGRMEPSDLCEILENFLAAQDNKEAMMAEQSHFKEIRVNEAPDDDFSDGYRDKNICYAHVGYGPLKVQTQSPFQSLRLGFTPRSPSTLTKNSFEAGLHETWVNVWAFDRRLYRIDYEALQSVLTVKYGITNTMEAELTVEDRRRFGGLMDGFIQGFHDTFGLDQGGRDEFPKGDFAIDLNSYKDQPAVSLDEGDQGIFSQNILFTIQHNVSCGTKYLPAFSYAFTGRYGDAVDFEDPYFFDMGVSVSASRRFNRMYAYLSFGYAWFGRDDVMGIKLDKTQFSLLCAFEWKYSQKQSLLIQYLLSEGAAKDWRDFSLPSHEVTVGWKGEIFHGMVLEVGLIENIIIYENSPDFGIHVGIVRRF